MVPLRLINSKGKTHRLLKNLALVSFGAQIIPNMKDRQKTAPIMVRGRNLAGDVGESIVQKLAAIRAPQFQAQPGCRATKSDIDRMYGNSSRHLSFL